MYCVNSGEDSFLTSLFQYLLQTYKSSWFFFFQIYKIMVVKRLDTRQQRTMILEQWETNKVNPVIVPLYCIKISRPSVRKGNPGSAGRNTWVEEMELEVKRPKQLGSQDKVLWEERAIQRRSNEDVWRIHLTYSVHTWENHLSPEKE